MGKEGGECADQKDPRQTVSDGNIMFYADLLNNVINWITVIVYI